MFDSDTLIITYDARRGEPRGSRSKSADYKAAGLGDCVDCNICVQACPTGIDIRRGLQYECIGCAACIDGCDQVMDKMGYAHGLIRYSTERAVQGNYADRDIVRHVLRPRTMIYATLLLAVVSAFLAMLYLRVPLKVDVIRDRAALAREASDGAIENVYRLQIMNTAEQPRRVTLTVSGIEGLRVIAKQPIELPPASALIVPILLRIDPAAATAGSHPVQIHVEDTTDARVKADEKSVFYVR